MLGLKRRVRAFTDGITSAHLIALLALFVSLGGTATAAIVISGRNIKNESVTSADIKNGSLLSKDFKSSELGKLKGAKGDTGATGATGAAGAVGAAGAKGDRGASAFDPPPSGTTIKGGGILSTNVSSGTPTLQIYSPLPFKLSVPLDDVGTGRNFYFGGTDASYLGGESDTTKCAGTAAAPVTEPGIFCVYAVGTPANVQAGTATLFGGVNTGATPDLAEQTGFYIRLTGTAGDVLFRYVWAYTAP